MIIIILLIVVAVADLLFTALSLNATIIIAA